jgi:hypothetical protein
VSPAVRPDPTYGWDEVVARAPNLTRHFRLVRSKDAGPFVLTTDLFCHDDEAYQRAVDAGLLDPAFWAEVYDRPVDAIEVHAVEAINAIKVSFPRPVASGDLHDTDITGGQQYAVVIDALARTPLADP